MEKDDFVVWFGGIFEYSLWIAECVWALELGVAYDMFAGLYNVLARMFCSVLEDERLGVLRVYFDLVGKLAVARWLMVEFIAEQVSVGLDVFIDVERARFMELNTAYVVRHGFFFIIVVCDNTKASILVVFEICLNNDCDIEFAIVCVQVERIARLCLEEML